MIKIIQSFGLDPADYTVVPIGTGHIHQTYKLRGDHAYILQRVNKNVFTQPDLIAANLRMAADYLKSNFPGCPFLMSIPSTAGTEMIYDDDGFPWRLFPYRENTVTIDKVQSTREAFSAASEFARLTACLNSIEVADFRETIPQFHDLALRYRQFEDALDQASNERKHRAAQAIQRSVGFRYLVDEYVGLIRRGSLRLRIVHNDTKINNILFDADSRDAVCVIDLDTLMPGYFIYDLGDMVRTFVSPVSEEEQDVSKIVFRKEIHDALMAGYLSQMESVMSGEEKAAIPFAGQMMTYIMAIRFLADYLRGDTYYHTVYGEQNLVRAENQLRLLQILSENL